jgi:hypothetical protein
MESFRRRISLSISAWAALMASGWLNAVTVSWGWRRWSIRLLGGQTVGTTAEMGRLTISGVNGGGCVFVNEQDKEFINKQGLWLTGRMLSAYLARGVRAAERRGLAASNASHPPRISERPPTARPARI